MDSHKGGPETERDKYTPDQDRSLSEAVLQNIEEYTGADMTKDEFILNDNINPDAIDTLFRHDAESNTTVMFDVNDVRVELWGDGGVEIRVHEQPSH